MYPYAGLYLIPPFVLYVQPILALIALVSYNMDFRSVTVAVLLCICSPFTPKGRGHCVTSRKVAGSIPDGVIRIFH